MKDFTGFEKQFTVLSQSYYADTRMSVKERAEGFDEIVLGYYAPEGGTIGELCIRWRPLEANKPPAPRLEAFDDSWHALASFKDVLDALAELDDTRPSVKEVVSVLLKCGFTDATQRESPPPRFRLT